MDKNIIVYLQLAISIVQVWSSKGYLLSSIIHENVSFNLEKYLFIKNKEKKCYQDLGWQDVISLFQTHLDKAS